MFGVDAGFEFGRFSQLPDCKILAKTQVYLATWPAPPQEAERPGDPLGLLPRAALFDRLVHNFRVLVVGDAHGNERYVVQPGPEYRLENVVKQAESRCQQLAGARTCTFQRPKQ